MMMPHPLLPMGLPPASVAMAMSQMNHLNTIANMAAAAQQIHTHVHRAPVIKVGESEPSFDFERKLLMEKRADVCVVYCNTDRGTSEESVLQLLLSPQERVCDSPSLSPSVDEANTPLQSQPSSSASSSPERLGKHPNREGEGGGEGVSIPGQVKASTSRAAEAASISARSIQL